MKKLFVLLAAVAFVVAFTAPSFAAEWSFYGSARIHTFWENYDYGDFTDGTGEDDDFDLDYQLQSNSRIGANVKVTDNLTGRFEYGRDPNLRILWGEYDFGGFKLGVGQHYTPLNFFYSNQVWDGDFDLLFAGGVYNGRRPMVQGKFGGFKIALIDPVTANIFGFDNQDTDVTIPNIQASYKFKVAGLSIDIGGGYQTYDVVDSNDDDESIDSYIIALGGTYNMGPFYFAANYWMGENVGNLGMVNTKSRLAPAAYSAGSAVYDPVDEDLLDNDGWGFIVCAAFTLSDMLRFEAGYAMNSFDIDEADEEDDTSTYYVQATITFAKGVFIVPEIGKLDFGDDPFGDDEGDLTYYGLKWQINF
jgi:hypothetical protein